MARELAPIRRIRARDLPRPVEIVRSAELQEAVTRACTEGLSSRLEVNVEVYRGNVALGGQVATALTQLAG